MSSPLPSNMALCTVRGRYGSSATVVGQSEPQFMPYQGMQVTFSPAYPFVTNTTATPTPVVIATTPRRFVTDSEGYLSDPVDGFDLDGKGNNRNCQIIASDDPDISPTNWKYLVTFTGPGATHFRAFRTPAPAGAVVDMAVITPQNVSTGTAPTQAEIAAANAAASAAAAQASVASIHRGQAGGVAPLDADGDVNDAFGNKILTDGGASITNPNTLLSKITDMAPFARLLNTDTSATAARSRLGAGTSNLAIGTTAGTAADAAATTTALNLRALNTGVVHTTGDETVGGVKQFTSPPTIPAATADDNPVTRAQLNSAIAGTGADADVVHKSGAETITGAKTYTISPTVPTATAAGHPVTKATYDTLATTVGGHTTSLTAALARITALETALGNPTTPIETTQNLYWDVTTNTYKDSTGALYNSTATHHNWYYGPNPQLLTPPITLQTGDTWTEAVVTPPAEANLLTIGTATHVLNGTNIPRGADQIIRYTYSTTQTITPTNQFGVEVTVNASTNKVTAVNDRIATGSTTGTPIASGFIIYSGHGQGAGTAGQWLRDNATVGATVIASTGAVTPPVDPTPVDPQPGTGMPAKVVSVYNHRWSGPRLRDYPTDVKNIVNEVRLALAQSGGAGTGNLSYAPLNGQTVAELATDVRAFVARGCNVLMGIGGSSDGGITITSDATADQAYNSIVGFVNTYGINGLDIDLEPSGSSWTQNALVRLCTRLKQTYGSGFIIGITPGLYGTFTASWMALANALGTNYDYMSPMLYDFPEAGDSRLSGVAVQKCDLMAAAGIPQSKMELGFMMRPNASYLNSTPDQALCVAAWNACKAKYPNIRGFFNWEDYILTSVRNWDIIRGLGVQVRGEASTATGTITSFTATAASGTQMNLAWAYTGTAVTSWTVKRGSTIVATLGTAIRTYSDTGLTPGTGYSYSVTANFTAGGSTTAATAGTTTSAGGGGTPGVWLSGGAGVGIADQAFQTWRNSVGNPSRPLNMMSTWSDTDAEAAANSWQFDPGQEYYSWTGSGDWAPGGHWGGETWAQEASGAFDARWTAWLNTLKAKWNRISRGTMYIRPWHEFNGNWFDWSVSAGDIANFKAAWIRLYNIKQAVWPQAKLTWSPNGDTTGQSYDFRTLWPGTGAQYVDVYGPDWYGGHWKAYGANGVDSTGAPTGLEQHRLFAASKGVPIAVPEWGIHHSEIGDNPAYMQFMYDSFNANAGTTGGKFIYECYFNVSGWNPNQFQIYPINQSLAPNAAAKYQDLF